VSAWRRLYKEGVLNEIDESNSTKTVERSRIKWDIVCTGELVD
jgi:hypothetical protein